ncbi:uncharacterized protein UTRI_06146 [Ustilago trichophora]|uniref:Uncharacterized protein n=1 Tax=Ustilago trichophora TaxID=86804 RepID=A0A5C3EHI6_9BASI|nr:uncharacterized protein UTRI_06146 [Ustilago trichophora]
MKKAQEQLKSQRPELPDAAARLYTGVKSQDLYKQQEAASVQHALAVPLGSKNTTITPTIDGTTSVDTQMVNQMEGVMEDISARMDHGDPRDEIFDQAQVLEGGIFDEPQDLESELAAAQFRISWLQFLGGISHAYERERKLLDFMVAVGFCPLCPFRRTNAFLLSSHQQVGLFADLGPANAFEPSSRSSPWQHMIMFHPSKLTALWGGQQLNPGIFQCPLVPAFAPHVWFQAQPEIANRYLAPISARYLDWLSNAQKSVVAKHMVPTLYMDLENASQVNWADKVAGKLLTSTLKKSDKATHSASQEKIITCSLTASVSYP